VRRRRAEAERARWAEHVAVYREAVRIASADTRRLVMERRHEVPREASDPE
jgi:hypothetical protein